MHEKLKNFRNVNEDRLKEAMWLLCNYFCIKRDQFPINDCRWKHYDQLMNTMAHERADIWIPRNATTTHLTFVGISDRRKRYRDLLQTRKRAKSLGVEKTKKTERLSVYRAWTGCDLKTAARDLKELGYI